MRPIAWVGSPNFTPGRQGYRPGAIVIHIMDGTLHDTDSWFTSTKSKVSAHYGLGRAGEVHQYVAEGDTAWHAGRVDHPTWTKIKPGVNPNLYTIGIEHEGKPGTPWTAELFDTSASLVAAVAARWAIPLDRAHVIGHCEIYSIKSFCPGSGVDLERLIAMARERLVLPDAFNLIADVRQVATLVPLNVRRGAPTADAPIVRTLNAGAVVDVVAWTSSGQATHGNAHWYKTAEGNFIWAGGTDAPVPMISVA